VVVLAFCGGIYAPGLVEWPLVEQSLRVVTFGDDIVASLGGIFQHVPLASISAEYAKIGMSFTDAQKTGVSKTKPIEECEFLKRGFRFSPRLGRYVAPLALDSILCSTSWAEKEEYRLYLPEQINTMLFELSLHGESVFNEHVHVGRAPFPPIADVLSAHNLLSPYISWEEAFAASGSLISYHQ